MFLPLCFIWSFVACEIICSEHPGQNPEMHVVNSAAEINGLEELDCCPVTGRIAISVPQRLSPIVQAHGGEQSMPTPFAQTLNIVSCSQRRALIWSSSSGPPLERLCVLRI